MKCQKCGVNQANISYTRMVNGDRTELHLCSECAKEMNIGIKFNFGMEDIFSHFFENYMDLRHFAIPEVSSMRTLESGLDHLWEDTFFNNDFFFTNDTEKMRTSKDDLDVALDEIQKKHNALRNTKKVEPEEDVKANKIDQKKNEIEQLKAKMQEYIKKEEYEKAAVLRDKIKELNEK